MGFIDSIGFDSTKSFIYSTLHPQSLVKTSIASAALACVGSFLETHVGIAPAVGIVMVILFVMELYTGVRASKLEGNKFESRKFQKGFIKMFLYIIMIGVMHTMEQHVEPKPMFGFKLNIYEWLHYFFLNFTVLQLIVSNIENFGRLGWDEFLPAISKISKFLNIKKNNEKPEEEEDVE